MTDKLITIAKIPVKDVFAKFGISCKYKDYGVELNDNNLEFIHHKH